MKFPSEVVVQMCAHKSAMNLTATEINGLSADEVAQRIKAIDGTVVINVAKATDGEKAVLRQAAEILPEGKVQFYQIASEDMILQQIVAELLGLPVVFYTFLQNLWNEGVSHFIEEWNRFIVAHEVAGKARNVNETHHWANVGLQSAEHPLRESVGKLVVGIPDDLRSGLRSLIPSLEKHPHIANEDDILFALVLAMLSNFVRGGVFYHLTTPSKVNSYFPRAVAVKTILSLK